MQYVVDANVVVKWLLPEPDSDKADSLIDGYRQHGMQLIAPDIVVAEVGNALWQRCDRLKDISSGEAASATRRTSASPACTAPGHLHATLLSAARRPVRCREPGHDPYRPCPFGRSVGHLACTTPFARRPSNLVPRNSAPRRRERGRNGSGAARNARQLLPADDHRRQPRRQHLPRAL